MEFRLNKEGTQYILGLPVKDDAAIFYQVVLSAGELEWLPSEATITGFGSLDDAQRAKEELQDRLGRLGRSPTIYRVIINRLVTEQVEKG